MTNQQPTNLNHQIQKQQEEVERLLGMHEIERDKPFRGLSHHGSYFQLQEAQRRFSELRASAALETGKTHD